MLKTTAIKLGLLTTLMCIASVANATTYFVYVPTQASVGGIEGELYSVQGFEAHDGLSGAALIDASMAELRRMIGADADAIEVVLRGTSATVSLTGPDKDTGSIIVPTPQPRLTRRYNSAPQMHQK